MMNRKLLQVARRVVKENLGLYYDERAYVLTDSGRRERVAIAKALLKASKEISLESFMDVMKPTGGHGVEPKDSYSTRMLEADILIMPTTYSLSHTNARKTASEMGARWASMPGITKDIFLRTLSLDYKKEVVPITNYVARKIRQSKRIKIETEEGTALTVYRDDKKVHEDTGIYVQKGEGGNLPAGEVCFGPVEGKSYGKLVIDAGVNRFGKEGDLLDIIIEGGKAVSLIGEPTEKLKEILRVKELGEKAYVVAEFGIGTNRKAKKFSSILEGEKILGTCHVAFGNNVGFGGKNDIPLHLDLILRNPTITLDENFVLMKDGALQGFHKSAA